MSRALVLRSLSTAAIFTMTYECSTSLTHCPHPASSSLRKDSAILHLFLGVCWDWLEPEAERLFLLFQYPSRLGGPWAGWTSASPRGALPRSPGRPWPPQPGEIPRICFTADRGLPFLARLCFWNPLPAPDGTRWDGRFGLRPWCEFWIWNVSPGVCVLKSFNGAFSNNVKRPRVAVSFSELSHGATAFSALYECKLSDCTLRSCQTVRNAS